MTKRHAMFHYTEKQKSLKIPKWQSEAVNLKTEKKPITSNGPQINTQKIKTN
jgi:hypothetical protein